MMTWRICVSAGMMVVGCLAMAAPVVPYAEALEKAKTSGSDIVVLTTGSDWVPAAREGIAIFEKVAAADKTTNVIWAVYDVVMKMDKKGIEALGKLPFPMYGNPGCIYMDREMLPLAHREMLTVREMGSLGAWVREKSAVRVARDALKKRADAAKGADKAPLLASALALVLDPVIDTLPFRQSGVYHGCYKKWIEELKAADTTPSKGYAFKYTFSFQGTMAKPIIANLKEKKFAENYAFVKEKLAIPGLTKTQRQQLLIYNFRTAREEGDLARALKYLDDAIACAPNTEYAANCLQMKRFYTESIVLPGYRWLKSDNRPEWTPTTLDISSAVKQAGTYTVEFKHTGGETRFRELRVLSNGKTLATATGQRRNFTFTLPTRSSGKLTLAFDMQGTGWFEGTGDILITPAP